MATTLEYKSTLNNSQFTKGMKENIDVTKSLTKAFGELAAIYLSFDFLKDSAKSFSDAETAADNLKQAVGASGGLASDFKDLQEQAEKLSSVGIFKVKDIEAAQALGLQFNMTVKQIEKSIPALLDWAARMNMGPTDAVNHLSKAMNGTDKLMKKLGFTFDDTKTKAQNLAIAQSILINKFQDSDRQIAETTSSGQLLNLANNFETLKEAIGAGLFEAFATIRPYLLEFIDWGKNAVKWIRLNWIEIKNLGEALTAVFLAFKVGTALGILYETIIGVQLVSALTGATTAQMLLNIAMEANPFGLLIVGITLVVGAIMYFKNQIDNLFNSFKNAFEIFNKEKLDEIGVSVNNLADYYHKMGLSVSDAQEKAIDGENKLLSAKISSLQVTLDQTEADINHFKLLKTIGSAFGLTSIVSKDEISNLLSIQGALAAAKNQQTKLNQPGIFTKQITKTASKETPAEKETPRENITINITKLVETLAVHAVSLKEGAAEIKEIIAATLQEAVYSVKYAGHQ